MMRTKTIFTKPRPITVRPTKADVAVANFVGRHTTRNTEDVAKITTWGADEHLLCALAAVWWVVCRTKPPDERTASNHVLLTTLAASALPHLLKVIFNQERPDRRTVRGHWRGIPLSGKRLDAFPSGHAIHIGALASAATELPPRQRNIVWGVGAGLVLTRIVLLAHWVSDVACGLVIGAALERGVRVLTGYRSARGHRMVAPDLSAAPATTHAQPINF